MRWILAASVVFSLLIAGGSCNQNRESTHTDSFSETWLFASDLDETLINRHDPTNSVQEEARRELRQFFGEAKASYNIAYITGKNFGEAVTAIEEYHLPNPNYIGADVGSRIYQPSSTSRQLSNIDCRWWRGQQWCENLEYTRSNRCHSSNSKNECWTGNDREKIQQFLHRLQSDASFLRRGQLNQQGVVFQNDFKVSWEIIWEEFDSPYTALTLFNLLETRAEEAGLNSTVLVTESSSTPRRKFYIDFFPQNGGKYGALTYLMQKLNISPQRVFYAGDSGNDRSVLSRTNAKCRVFVGGQKSVWNSWYIERNQKNQNPGVFLAPHVEVQGVLDGIRQCGFLTTTR